MRSCVWLTVTHDFLNVPPSIWADQDKEEEQEQAQEEVEGEEEEEVKENGSEREGEYKDKGPVSLQKDG